MAALALLALGACADDTTPPPLADTAPPDSGTEDSGVVDTGLGTTPDPPLSPVLTPCPEGWVSVDPGGGAPVVCDALPSPPAEPCGPGEAHFAGEAGCAATRPSGSSCPADGWPVDLPADRPALYVRADAPAGGDGSLDAPFTSIQSAVSVAVSPTVVAVAPGLYPGAVSVDGVDVSVIGACLDVVIDGRGAGNSVDLRGMTGGLANVTVLVDGAAGIFVRDSTVALSSVEVRGEPGSSPDSLVFIDGATLVAESVVLRGPAETGMTLYTDSTATLRRTVIEGVQDDGLNLTHALLRAESIVIRDFGAQAFAGSGIYAAGDSEVSVARAAIVGGFGTPIFTADVSRVALVDVAISGPPAAEAAPDCAVVVLGDTDFSMERVSMRGMRNNGIVVAEGVRFTAADVSIVDTGVSEGNAVGYGLEIAAAATATLQRIYVDRATAVGLLLDGGSTTLDATDLVIGGTWAHGDGTFGRGIQVQRGAFLDLTRAELRDNREVAVAVAGAYSSLRASHLSVVDTLERLCSEEDGTCDAAGIGIGVYAEGAIEVDHFRVAGNFLAGVQIATDGGLDLSDGVVEGNPVGANIQVSGYDTTRLTSNVVYRDNGQNLDTAELVVPAPDVSGIR